MNGIQINEEAVFDIARRIKEPELRTEYVDQACASDPSLKRRITELLELHDREESFLESPPAGLPMTLDLPQVTEKPGDLIGPYKLRELLGEGGMGVVYVAEQEEPVRRKVALKIIKPGMDTKEVIARFEAERQALAIMDHPNIAKVLEAGSTDSGRPYFVMELVRGLPITEYCNKQKLNTRQRLKLFVTVCEAVQHAHQKGIIHRDIKPSNVLVTRNGERAIPKMIDFGVAKATNQRLTDQTIYTHFSQMIGTPLYMSPEQAEMSELDVDTRSDVYSLGVVLYELLAGSTPFEREKLRSLGYDEIRRIIREDDPARPSERISTLAAEALSTISEQRGSDSRKLMQSVRGELDWIVMRALEKDRNRRYESASAFATDIERYLNQEPIAAGPPSLAYQAKKYVQRNRVSLLTASLVSAVCLAGVVVPIRAKLQANSVLQQISGDVEQSMSAAQAAVETHDLVVARQRIGEAEGRLVSTRNQLPQLVDRVQLLKTEIDERRSQQERVQQFEELAHQAMDGIFWGNGEQEAVQAVQALEMYGVLSDDAWVQRLKKGYLSEQQQDMVLQTAYETLLVLADYGVRWGAKDKKAENAPASLRHLERAEAFHDPTRAFFWIRSECLKLVNLQEEAQQDLERFNNTAATTAFDYFAPGHTAGWRGDLKEAIRSYEAALRMQPDHFNSLFFLAMRLARKGRTAEAAQLYQACLAIRPDHVHTLINRAFLLIQLGESEKAILDLSHAISLEPKNVSRVRAEYYMITKQFRLAEQDLSAIVKLQPESAAARNHLAWFLATCPEKQFHDPRRAIELAEKAIEDASRSNKPLYLNTLGVAHFRAGNWNAAIEALDKSDELMAGKSFSFNGFFLAMAHWQLGHADEARDWYDRAVDWMDKEMPDSEELGAFRAEAEELLGITNGEQDDDVTEKD